MTDSPNPRRRQVSIPLPDNFHDLSDDEQRTIVKDALAELGKQTGVTTSPPA